MYYANCMLHTNFSSAPLFRLFFICIASILSLLSCPVCAGPFHYAHHPFLAPRREDVEFHHHEVALPVVLHTYIRACTHLPSASNVTRSRLVPHSLAAIQSTRPPPRSFSTFVRSSVCPPPSTRNQPSPHPPRRIRKPTHHRTSYVEEFLFCSRLSSAPPHSLSPKYQHRTRIKSTSIQYSPAPQHRPAASEIYRKANRTERTRTRRP
ncbi:uncharacterized protein J3D65DRAFT_378267 [Phyllosticta citribraziliensis]|uniref:Secreted protein n=1 Tax=Phyllosticta citribraziliensis TaxID=989973 RepID=A0ABR1LQA9_9PEZI